MLQETQQHYYNRPQSFAPKFHQVPVPINKPMFCQEKGDINLAKEEIAPEWQNPRRDRYPPRSQCMLQGCVLDYLQNRLAFVHLWIYIIKYGSISTKTTDGHEQT